MEGAAASAAAIESELRRVGTPERAAGEKAYLKSDLEFAGASVPQVRATVRAWRADHPPLERRRLLALVRALWRRPVHECRAAAVELLEEEVELLTAADLGLLEQLLRQSRTWALSDSLAASVVGPLVERCPELGSTLDRWARDDDFWLRRASLLAQLLALRAGRGDFDRFARYADPLLEDPEFFIRKAIGWVLRDTARTRPELVATWLGPRMARASTVTVREAVKPLPPDVRARLLAARPPRRRA